MAWNFDNHRSIYLQLVEQITLRILNGTYPLSGKLPSVRELATEAGVNPNTMQKALTELERKELVHSQRTNGRFVTDKKETIMSMKDELAKQILEQFLAQMLELGYTREYILQLIQKEGQ